MAVCAAGVTFSPATPEKQLSSSFIWLFGNHASNPPAFSKRSKSGGSGKGPQLLSQGTIPDQDKPNIRTSYCQSHDIFTTYTLREEMLMVVYCSIDHRH